ncbi:acetolactate synthase-1/2/3 large subunit [Pigmentiphaga litoralis]|uniref:Acetolactate synthase-1/2/3 large subunit n=2 Tax=Pigmentiphaga litoralis TaxID=516702 RepID=A0A7Y9IR40_9BURK|nr:thiamine pyrophosphate-binding protein [Pigmentiphaga litoralis]NYE24856.1 acetolactate synthase-1/2/3 large subunit [Pigmentiphaga litoralis]NYE81530.1 acetolactate synthase-1/2/3 large subunit [Pigmentiphaga litoralis]
MNAATPTVGDAIVDYLHRLSVEHAFGVLSIHNMPLLDALGRDGRIRYVGARGEAGAVGMADACARVTGRIGVAFTSTGTGAGNAAGALIEALTAGTPLLHITGQVAVPYLDRGRSYVHETKDQLSMLTAVSKAAFRVWSARTALATLEEAARVAMTAPTGPVSVEIPIDLQGEPFMAMVPAAPRVERAEPDDAALRELAIRLKQARRPLLWVGGGARHAKTEVRRLLDMGFAVVTTLQGRGIVPEDDPRTLAAFNSQPAIEAFYGTCDALLVVGSRLRVPETLTHTLKLPTPCYQIDADPLASQRGYPTDLFVCADAQRALSRLIALLEEGLAIDPALQEDAATARHQAASMLRAAVAPYDQVADALQMVCGRDFNWVRDVTISNSTWGNRLFPLLDVAQGVHAVGGGIGQGLAMAIGAAVGTPGRRTWALAGDGGFMLNLGELATAVQEDTGMVLLVMNDGGYGILRNLQDADYGGRRYYADLHGFDLRLLAESVGASYLRVGTMTEVQEVLAVAARRRPPVTLIEFDMQAIGPFAKPFTGPPLGKG